jgi:4-alpha-glucanotransferase
MHLTFRVRFHTQAGQSIWFAGEPPLPGAWVLMQFQDREFWEVSLALDRAELSQPLNYSYVLSHANGSQTADWGRDRALIPADFAGDQLLVIDAWNEAGFPENAFSTRPFKKVLLADHFTEVPAVKIPDATHTFRVQAPLLARGQTVCLLGEGPALGNWQTHRPRLLRRARGEDAFSVPLDLRGQPFPLAYKYGVYDVEKEVFVRYEEGANRTLKDSVAAGKHTLVNDGFLRLPAATWRGAGVAVPVFSLRSQHSFGVGEFPDLKRLADWGGKTGLKLIQLLPVNDTSGTHTWRDSYPYAAISVFALHPLYLNLAAVANAKNQKRLAGLEPQRQHLNALEAVDYEAVMRAKLGFLKEIFPSQKAETFRSRAYRQFFADHHRWLVPYAAFCVLRDRFGTPDFSQWPEHRRFEAQAIAALARDNDEVAFHYFLQFHLHQQLLEATAHVHACGLVLKGDLAIGVHRHSADVWQQPELFHVDRQAGAPPDAFSAKGQNWGFPTYNWPRMAADGFAWWKQRFAQMSGYFDAFRIDHILGFFRIWSSPAHAVEGILGRFEPAIPVAIAEFAARGIPFAHERLTTPFINDAVLAELFGQDQALVRRDFLNANSGGTYALKPEFATQRQVENHFSKRAPDAADWKLKTGLFDLISNVILFDAEGAQGKQFHFRFAMHDTTSFKHLPPVQQPKLRELYMDYFFRRQDDFWLREAMQKLPALKRGTDMLVCGEDLGLVPACVPGLMKDLGLLSLEIQRMPKVPGRDFSRPAEAPYLSVVTPSTHDMSTLRGWWEEDADLTRKFFNRELGRSGEAPRACGPELVEAILQQHLASPAMWSIFQLQDLLGMDAHLRRAEIAAERINLPAIPDYYWRYRMHLNLEQLLLAEDFNVRLAKLIRENGR